MESIQSTVFNLTVATLLNGGLNTATAPSALLPRNQAMNLPMVATPLVHLSAGPSNLNLLGMSVTLDNSDTTPGPVVTDAYVQPSSGELLSNVLNTVAQLVDPNQTSPSADSCSAAS